MEPHAAGTTRVGIEILTDWLNARDRDAKQRAIDHVVETIIIDADDDAVPGFSSKSMANAINAVTGLLNVGMLLLLTLAKAPGATDDETFEEAGKILRALALDLPD